MQKFGIEHRYSSPYCPSANGGVERANRTLINLIKGSNCKPTDWDIVLSKAVYNYNNTYHSQLKMSPSQFLLENAHRPDAEIPVGKDVIDYWREGHPNFKPFKIKQKVIREIPRVGDRAIYKLLPKYDGPYTVQKVHSNGLSYDIVKEDDEQERII